MVTAFTDFQIGCNGVVLDIAGHFFHIRAVDISRERFSSPSAFNIFNQVNDVVNMPHA